MFQDFSSFTHTHKTLCILIYAPFSPLTLLPPLYIPTLSPSCHTMSNTHRQKMMSFTINFSTTPTKV